MAHMERAAKDSRMNHLLGRFDSGLKESVLQNGPDKPTLVRNIFDHVSGDPDYVLSWRVWQPQPVPRNKKLRRGLTSSASCTSSRARSPTKRSHGLRRWTASSFPRTCSRWSAKDGRPPTKETARAPSRSLGQLPSEWRGKKHRRAREPVTETARQDAEAKERLKWAKELAGLLFEAKLSSRSPRGLSRRTRRCAAAKGCEHRL